MNFVFTARRSFTGSHVNGVQYAATFSLQSLIKRRDVVKSVQRSLSGATETLYHRGELAWQMTFAPVNGSALLGLVELLDSTESGEVFSATLNGDINPAVNVRRIDNGYTLSLAQELGQVQLDYFTASIEVVQAL